MRNFEKNKLKSKNGITLIALVVTIIVLIILTGATIIIFNENNGIITKASEAKKDTNENQVKEEIILAWNAVQMRGIPREWTLEQKRDSMQTELRKEDSTATATINEQNIDVIYKGYQATIDVFGEKVEQIAKVNNPNPPLDPNQPQKHPDQRNTNDIGIGADGNSVNLDLWNYVVVANHAELREFTGSFMQPCYIPYCNPNFPDSDRINFNYASISDYEYHNPVAPQYIKVYGTNDFVPVTKIGYSAFRNCENLYSIVLPSTLEEIEYSCFEACSNLTSITLPSSVRIIGTEVFKECTNLTSVYLSDSLQEIRYGAFSDSSVNDIHIPSGMTYTNWMVNVVYCEYLSSIYNDSSVIYSDLISGHAIVSEPVENIYINLNIYDSSIQEFTIYRDGNYETDFRFVFNSIENGYAKYVLTIQSDNSCSASEGS